MAVFGDPQEILMERVRRRWVNALTLAAATVVVLAALVSGVFQTIVYLLPSYRDDLSLWVTRVAGRPVQIGGINLVWRGVRPRLDLANITLFSEDGETPALSAQRLSLGISPLRLMLGDLTPVHAEFSGLNLGLHLDGEGRLSVVGFDPGGEPFDAALWLRKLEGFRGLRLVDCAVSLELPQGAPLQFGLRSFEASRSRAGFSAEGDLALPPQYGESLVFESELQGDVSQPETWSGELSGEASGLQLQPWLRAWVQPGTGVGVDSVDAEYEGRIEQGGLAALALKVAAENLTLVRGGTAQESESLLLALNLSRQAQAWQLELQQIVLDEEDQFRGSLRYLALPQKPELAGEVELLRLTRLAPYLQYLARLPPEVSRLGALSGELSGLTLRYAGTQYSVSGEIRDLSLPAAVTGAGFGGLSGRLSATEAAGSLELAGTPLRLSLPRAFYQDIPFEALSGQFKWQRTATGWTITAPEFGWQLAGSEGQGRLRLDLPADSAQSPLLDLAATFSAADAARLKPWIPRRWGEGLRKWLERGILGARIPAAELVIRGPLRQFPFLAEEGEPSSGEWKLDLDLADGRLNYAPGWPALDELRAKLEFRGNGLVIRADNARLGDNRADSIEARFVDFRDHLLTVDASVVGWMTAYYDYLRTTPLRTRLAGLLDNTRAAGAARVSVHLNVPLSADAVPSVNGTVTMDKAELTYQGLEQPITGIAGTLEFDDHGVSAEELAAVFMDVPLEARIEPREGTSGVVVAEFPYAPDAAGQGLSSFVPEIVRRGLTGQTRFRAELPLGGPQAGLLLSTDLRGIAVSLPAPLAKPADAAADLRVAIGADAAAPLRVKVDYENRLGADIALARDAAALRTTGINLRLGAGAMPPAATEGLRLSGQTAEMDLAAWAGAIQGASLQGLALREAQLGSERWFYKEYSLRGAVASLKPVTGGWDIALSGPAGEGSLGWRSDATGSSLSARLERLQVEAALAPAAALTGAATPAEPAQFPALDLDVGAFKLNGTDFGHLELLSRRIAGGIDVQRFALSGGVVDGVAGGQWLRSAGQSSGKLRFTANSRDLGDVLSSLGFAPNVTARNAYFEGDLAWDPAAAGIDWEQARGRVQINLDNGNLKAVEPGAGRVLGLLNFYALPRRLSLDFRDVLSSGLGYDRVRGHFDLAGGSATTQDLEIRGPSLRMELHGRIGLAARDYDQRVTVYPDLSSGVTLGTALFAGPGAAVLAFIAQQMLDKPLDQVTQLSYQVTGPWDNPEVKRIEQAPAAETAPARPR